MVKRAGKIKASVHRISFKLAPPKNGLYSYNNGEGGGVDILITVFGIHILVFLPVHICVRGCFFPPLM